MHYRDITEKALEEGWLMTADKTPIALMNGEQLVTLLIEHGIGVRRSESVLFEIDEEK